MARLKEDTDPAVAKRRAKNKASRIRRKLEEQPDKVDPSELAYLADYEASLGRTVSPQGADTLGAVPSPAPGSPDVGASPAPSVPVLPAPPPAPPSSSSASSPPRPPLVFPPPPPPPPAVAGVAGAKASGRWQDKYGAQMGGREMACILVGDSVHEFVVAMQNAITESGGRPAVDATAMRPIFILAADDLLPPHVEATAPVLAACTTATLTLQAFVRRKAIKEAQARKSARGGKLVAMDGGRKDAPPSSSSASSPVDDRAAPASELDHDNPAGVTYASNPDQVELDLEPAAPEQPADGRAPVREADYITAPVEAPRVYVPPGFDGLS